MKERKIPEYNVAVMCPHCGEYGEIMTDLYGLIGGGVGPYTMCADCGELVTKSYESHEDREIIDAEFTEVPSAVEDKGGSAK